MKHTLILLVLIGTGFLVLKYYRPNSDQGSNVKQQQITKNDTSKLEVVPTNIPVPSSSPSPLVKTQYKIHIYNEPTVDIEKIKILGIYFVAKGDEDIANPTWREDMNDVLTQVANFYRRELKGNSEIRVVIAPQIIGKRAYNDYQYSNEITDEVKSRLFKQSGDLYDSEIARVDQDEYQSLIFFIDYTLEEINKGPIQNFGAGLDYDKTKLVGGLGTMGAFWLKKEARTKDYYGVIGAAHEFGHTLSIPHPWEDKSLNPSGDKNFGKVRGNIMGYNFGNIPLLDGYLMPEQKRKLGID